MNITYGYVVTKIYFNVINYRNNKMDLCDIKYKILKYLDHTGVKYYDFNIENPISTQLEFTFGVEDTNMDLIVLACEKIGKFIEEDVEATVNVCQIGGR